MVQLHRACVPGFWRHAVPLRLLVAQRQAAVTAGAASARSLPAPANYRQQITSVKSSTEVSVDGACQLRQPAAGRVPDYGALSMNAGTGSKQRRATAAEATESLLDLIKVWSPSIILLQEYGWSLSKLSSKLGQFGISSSGSGSGSGVSSTCSSSHTWQFYRPPSSTVWEPSSMPAPAVVWDTKHWRLLEVVPPPAGYAGRCAVVRLVSTSDPSRQLLVASYHGKKNGHTDGAVLQQARAFVAWLAQRAGKLGLPALVGGDWNVALHKLKRNQLPSCHCTCIVVHEYPASQPSSNGEMPFRRRGKDVIDYFVLTTPCTPAVRHPAHAAGSSIQAARATPLAHHKHASSFDHDPVYLGFSLKTAEPADDAGLCSCTYNDNDTSSSSSSSASSTSSKTQTLLPTAWLHRMEFKMLRELGYTLTAPIKARSYHDFYTRLGGQSLEAIQLGHRSAPAALAALCVAAGLPSDGNPQQLLQQVQVAIVAHGLSSHGF